jgi:hypothetical protein
MRATTNFPDSFTVEDIRRVRDEFDRRHTDENGNYDWEGAFAETERGAALVRAELDRVRSERELSVKGVK